MHPSLRQEGFRDDDSYQSFPVKLLWQACLKPTNLDWLPKKNIIYVVDQSNAIAEAYFDLWFPK